MKTIGTTIIAAALGLGACGEGDARAPGTHVAINVAPLSLPGISNVAYTVTVTNGAGQTVWTKALTSAQYGSPRGDVSYVGTCDASSNPNHVRLLIDGMTDDTGAPVLADTWRNPTPVTRDVTCSENADVAVTFNLVIARDAQQGFFDIAVNFADIFCSAKLDCVDELLHRPGGERDDTVVVGLACTSGNGETTWLHQDALVLSCSDGTVVTTNPPAGPGQFGGSGPYVFQRATYLGMEEFGAVDKCYWNTALGIDEDAIPAAVDCTLTGRATASPTAWAQGFSPADTVWPQITYSVKVVANGEVACGAHPLDVTDSGVATGYPAGASQYAYSMQCKLNPSVSINGFACDGQVAGFDAAVVFAATPSGVVVSVAGVPSAPMPLPAGASLEGCCADGCCTE